MHTKFRSICVLVLPLVTIFMVEPLWAQGRIISPRPVQRPLEPPPGLRLDADRILLNKHIFHMPKDQLTGKPKPLTIDRLRELHDILNEPTDLDRGQLDSNQGEQASTHASNVPNVVIDRLRELYDAVIDRLRELHDILNEPTDLDRGQLDSNQGEQASTHASNVPNVVAVTLIICSILLIAIVAAKLGGTPSAASVTGKTSVITPSSESSQAETPPPKKLQSEMVCVVDSKGVANRQ